LSLSSRLLDKEGRKGGPEIGERPGAGKYRCFSLCSPIERRKGRGRGLEKVDVSRRDYFLPRQPDEWGEKEGEGQSERREIKKDQSPM